MPRSSSPTSSGTPSAARLRMTVSGLRMPAVSGRPGSTSQIGAAGGRQRTSDRQRRADDDHRVGRRGDPGRTFEHRDRLAEEDDMRPQQRPVRRRGVERLLPAVEGHDEFGIARRTELAQLAVQVRHARRSGPLVQVIDVLRHHLDLAGPLQPRDGLVRGVRPGGEHLAAALVVKPDHQRAVAGQRLGRADLLDPVIGPEPVRIAEGRKAAVGAHSGAGKNDDFLHIQLFPPSGRAAFLRAAAGRPDKTTLFAGESQASGAKLFPAGRAWHSSCNDGNGNTNQKKSFTV